MAVNGLNGVSMQVTLNVGSNNGPTAAERTNFQNSLKDKSPEELAKMLGDQNLKPWQKRDILDKLLDQLLKSLTDPQDKKDAQDAANNAMNNKNGKINPEALSKLLEMLGVDHDSANLLAGMAAAVSGGDGGGDGGDGGDTGV